MTTETHDPTLADNVDTTESAEAKRHAAPPEVRRTKPPVEASALRHRELRDDEFWRRIPAWAEVDREQFLDTRWQMKNSVNSEKKLLDTVRDIAPAAWIDDAVEGFRRAPMSVRVTPYIMSLIDWEDPYHDPLRTQFIPIASRLMDDHPMLTLDSLHEQADAPVPGLTHRYQDKALFLPLDTCPVYCRFCTRSYAIGTDTDTVEKVSLKVNPKRWEDAFAYIESRPELEDIVISGGDTFNLAFKHIENIGMRLLHIPHVRRLRFATKGLAVMPMKILSDQRWLDALTNVVLEGRRLHKQVVIHTHFNHPNEITEITRQAMNVLFERGILVRNQTVLQHQVNDDADTMWLLVKRLGEVNVHPYYVYQHDMVHGVEDLRTPVRTTIGLEKYIRGTTAGFNIPLFIVDAPGGGGKRGIHSYEHYDRETGISVYTAPNVKKDQQFMYFDPLHSLSESARADWANPARRDEMVQDALSTARVNQISL